MTEQQKHTAILKALTGAGYTVATTRIFKLAILPVAMEKTA